MRKFETTRSQAVRSTAPTLDGTRLQALPQQPLATSIPNACAVTGFSRSVLYRLLASQQISAVKSGRRTLILMDSLRQYLASLPTATFREQSNRS